MTAEIAVMNRSAIALAADSAVTIPGSADQKIYNTVNKLFTLSKLRPVGVMVFGNGLFMGVPWETIIKVYREKLGAASHDTLREYAEGFLQFIKSNEVLFPVTEQDQYFRRSSGRVFEDIVRQIRQRVQKEPPAESEIPGLVAEVIAAEHSDLSSKENLPEFSADFVGEALRHFDKVLDELISEIFQLLPLSVEVRVKLKEVAVLRHCKPVFPDYSGVVVAGFGEEEIFPSIIAYEIECKIRGRLKFRKGQKSATIGFENTATITPFAQVRMAVTFIEGLDPNLRSCDEISIAS